MEIQDKMDLVFKAALKKEWRLLKDRVRIGNKEILLEEIERVEVFMRPTIATNGIIYIIVNGKKVTLVYPNRAKADGEKAIEYMRNNCKFKAINEGGNEVDSIENKIDVTSTIQEQIDSLPYKDSWGTKKEIKELPHILSRGEDIKAITSGLVNGNTWLVVCTNKRVLMLDKGMIYGLRLIDIPLDKINSIGHSKGLIMGKISITDGAGTRTIDNVAKDTVSFFADTVNKEIEIYQENKNAKLIKNVNTISVADEILKFKELLDMGVLTQEEFDNKKKQLLG